MNDSNEIPQEYLDDAARFSDYWQGLLMGVGMSVHNAVLTIRIDRIKATGERPAILDNVLSQHVNEAMEAVQKEYALPRKLSGFDEACEVAGAGRCVTFSNPSEYTRYKIVDGHTLAATGLGDNQWAQFYRVREFRDTFCTDADKTFDWFEVADPTLTIAESVKREG